MHTPSSVQSDFESMLRHLRRRSIESRLLTRYYRGKSPLPKAIVQMRVTKAYRILMPMAEAPWGSLVVDSYQDRLRVAGIRDKDQSAADAVWGIWQNNQMDAESLLGHKSALTSGRAFALVWPNVETGEPEITLESAEQMIVKYREGSRRHRVAALRYWDDDDRAYATVYYRNAIWKFSEVTNTNRTTDAFRAGGKLWDARLVDGEDWPLGNPFDVVPVVELPVNRELEPGSYGYARGVYEHCTGLIDRINLLTFLGLVVAFWMGFPLRGVIGEKILRDDTGKPIQPFDAHASGLAQLENPQAKIFEYKEADRKNLSIFAELDQLATICKVPRYYFPMEQGMSNLSADAIRASDGSLVAQIPVYHGQLGEGWEETLRVGGLMLPTPVNLSPRAELQWMDYESRSLAERADAAIKLKDTLPWQVIAERVLNATEDEINRWAAMRSGDTFAQLVAAANQPVPPPAPEPAPATT